MSRLAAEKSAIGPQARHRQPATPRETSKVPMDKLGVDLAARRPLAGTVSRSAR